MSLARNNFNRRGPNMLYYVYILGSGRHGTLYIGITNNLARRLEQHRMGRGSEFVRKYSVYRLVHAESYETPVEAIAREKKLKKWKRIGKFSSLRKIILNGAICPIC
jgi:putative endonuclease